MSIIKSREKESFKLYIFPVYNFNFKTTPYFWNRVVRSMVINQRGDARVKQDLYFCGRR